MLELLVSDELIIKEQILWVLGNVAGDCDECRNRLCLSHCVRPFLQVILLESGTESLEVLWRSKTAAAWAISNLMRGSTSAQVLLSEGTKEAQINHSY